MEYGERRKAGSRRFSACGRTIPVWRRMVVLAAACLAAGAALSGCSTGQGKRYLMDGRELSWAEMDRDQRKRHMRQVVLPLAESVFQDWRPEQYADVSCTLCHGRGAEQDDFRMPTAHLPRLSGELFLGTEFREHPETTGLKLDRLVPGMAEALGTKEFSLLTRRGFGCYSCHLGPDGPMFGN